MSSTVENTLLEEETTGGQVIGQNRGEEEVNDGVNGNNGKQNPTPPLSPVDSDPSVFKQAWNLISDVYQGFTEPLPSPTSIETIIDDIPSNVPTIVEEFEAKEQERTSSTILFGNSKRFISQDNLRTQSSCSTTQKFASPLPLLPVDNSNCENFPSLINERRARSKPESGINRILENQPIVGTHRSNQAESTAQEYQSLLDGIQSYYPFIKTSSGNLEKAKKSSVKQMARFIDSNCNGTSTNCNAGQFLQGVRLRSSSARHYHHHRTETTNIAETLLFHPTSTRLSTAIGTNHLQEYYSPTKSEIQQRPLLPSRQQAQAYVQENQYFLRNINEQLNILNQERYSVTNYEQKKSSGSIGGTNNLAKVHCNSGYTQQLQQQETNCNQNNNVNINLTLALQQQNGEILASPPVLVNYSTSKERQTQLLPSNLNVGEKTKRLKIKVDSCVQTEFAGNLIDLNRQRRGSVSSRKKQLGSVQEEADNANPFTRAVVLPTGSGTITLNEDDLQDYSHLIPSEAQFPSLTDYSPELEPDEEDSSSPTPAETAQEEEPIIVGRMRPERSWLNTLDISQIALSYTGESIRKLLEIADDVVTHYVFPLDERQIFSEEELLEGDEKLGVALLGLMGVPQQHRNQIYYTALENVQAIHEISKGTADVLRSVVEWLTTANEENESQSVILNKARILASMSTEIDPESEVWKQFERDVVIFTEAVTSAMSSGYETVKAISRKCSETVLNYLSSASSSEMDVTTQAVVNPRNVPNLETISEEYSNDDDLLVNYEDSANAYHPSNDLPELVFPSSSSAAKDRKRSKLKRNLVRRSIEDDTERDIKLSMLREALKEVEDEDDRSNTSNLVIIDRSTELQEQQVDMDSDAVDLDKSNKRIHLSRSFTVPDNDQYKYGIASAIASAAESITSSIISNLKDNAVSYFPMLQATSSTDEKEETRLSRSASGNELNSLHSQQQQAVTGLAKQLSETFLSKKEKELEENDAGTRTEKSLRSDNPTPSSSKKSSRKCKKLENKISDSDKRIGSKNAMCSSSTLANKTSNETHEKVSYKILKAKASEDDHIEEEHKSTENDGLDTPKRPELDDSVQSINDGYNTPERPNLALSEPELDGNDKNEEQEVQQTEALHNKKSEIAQMLHKIKPYWPKSVFSGELPSNPSKQEQNNFDEPEEIIRFNEDSILPKRHNNLVVVQQALIEEPTRTTFPVDFDANNNLFQKNNKEAANDKNELKKLVENLINPIVESLSTSSSKNTRKKGSRIPVLKSALPVPIATNNFSVVPKESKEFNTISIYHPKPVRPSCVALDNPIAQRTTRSSCAKKYVEKWLEPTPPRTNIGRESSTGGFYSLADTRRSNMSNCSISTVGSSASTRSIKQPLKALHPKPKKSKVEIIDIIPIEVLTKGKGIPSLSSGGPVDVKKSNSTSFTTSTTTRTITGNTSPATASRTANERTTVVEPQQSKETIARSTPQSSISTTKRYTSKPSYKQLMMEKKQFLQQKTNTIKVATPTLIKTNTVVPPQKARTFQDKRNVTKDNKQKQQRRPEGSYLAVHGSQSFLKSKDSLDKE